MKLDSELNKFSLKEDSNSVKEIQEATLLLEAPKESLAILEKINLDHQIHKNRKKVETSQKLKALEVLFNSKTYTGKQLKELCNFYDLKCLYAQEYKGKLDPELPNKLKEFEDTNNITLRARDCFILAISNSFNKDCEDSTSNCIFLYREGCSGKAEENEVFNVIHSWGESIKPIRKYKFLLAGNTFFGLLMLFIGLGINNCIIATTIFTLLGIIAIIAQCNIITTQDEKWNSLEKK